MKIQLRVFLSTLLISQLFLSISPAVAELEPCIDMNRVETIDGIDYVCTAEAEGNFLEEVLRVIPEATFAPAELVNNGYSFRISNYSPEFQYSVEGSTGNVYISQGGLVTVVGNFTVDEILELRTSMGQFYRLEEIPDPVELFKSLPLPSFGDPQIIGDRVDIQILNYSQRYDWDIQSSFGDALIDNTGLISIFRTQNQLNFALTIAVGYSDFPLLQVVYRIGKPLQLITPLPENNTSTMSVTTPTFSEIESRSAHSFSFRITNFTLDLKHEVMTTVGQASISTEGVVSVIGLGVNESSTVTLIASQIGYESSTALITGSSFLEISKLTSLQLKKIMSKPSQKFESGFQLFGKIVQSNRGQNSLLASISFESNKKSKVFKENLSWFTGSSEVFKNLAVGDFFSATVEVTGYKNFKVNKVSTRAIPVFSVIQLSRY